MNNFFYDLNKRMADIGQKQTLSEGVVTERATGDYSAKKAAAGKDIGKPGKNFSKIAKGAAERYGSKAAGERVAGAVLNKLRGKNESQLDELSPDTIASYQKKAYPQATTTGPKSDQRTAGIVRSLGRPTKEGMEEGQLNELSPELLKRARDAAGMKYAQADDRRDQKASDKYNRQDDKFNSALRKKQKDMDEGRVDDVSKSVKSIYYPDKARSPVQKFDKSTGRFDKYMGKNSPLDDKEFAPDQTSRPAGMNPDPASRYAMGEAELDEVSRGEYIKQQDTNAEKSGKQKFNAFGQTFDTDEIDEGGLPMTTVNGKKVPKFAADGQGANDLVKKKSFNDKIAGAKQEVEEMLGDVAAEAMRNALGKKQMAGEGFDDMERDVKRRLSTPKVGDVKRGARHDIETTATGIRATRRHDDETDDQPTGEKRRAGRPKGADKGPERVTGKAYKHKGGRVKEGNMSDMIEPYDADEYDSEGDMAKEQLHTMKLAAMELSSILSDDENLPEWVQSKITKALDYVDTARDYMISTKADRGMAVDEEKTSTRDSRAERAGRKVTKDIEYDEKKKDGIHGKRRGGEDDRAEKAGKKVTKDIEYDEKKKEKKVDETTTSGSVATGGDAPKASKGGMQVGKGIYDSMNREVENMIAESMSINVSMSTDDNGSHKNITVTAADEDAEMLAQLLRSAGLGGSMSQDHDMAEAYGDVTATENKPDYPTDTEYSDDAMQYSGGLNGPKSTGQTTIPVIAHQGARTGVDDEELRRMMEMAGIKQQELEPWERTMKEEEAVEEGVVDKVKDVVKKGLEKLGHGSDEDMRKDLQKKMGVPPTGEKPADKKMEESLMKEFANFRI